jgi:sialate O-acetylesterase
MSVRGVLLVLAVVLLSTNALPFLATIFQANMVLQSGRPILVWGWDTAPATTVSLNINGIGYKNMSATIPTVRGAYYWSVTLAPLPVSFTPLTMFIKSTSNNVQVLSNILVGDVYLCGGQSNAQMSVRELIFDFF